MARPGRSLHYFPGLYISLFPFISYFYSQQMEEAFLHFIWKFQQFDHSVLNTADGHPIDIFNPGFKNSDAGPDFKNAKIRIGEIVWNGNVEIHVNAADWRRHNHQKDPAYDNVILHVVWKNDEVVSRNDGTSLPALELEGLVSDVLIFRYRELLTPLEEILCRRYLPQVKPVTRYQMLDGALARRLEKRAQKIFREVGLTDQDWEEIAWRTIARNFGFKTNADAFTQLARSLPLKILKKEAHNQLTIEALMFGQAGFLEETPADEYQAKLAEEYVFKAGKYNLDRRLSRHQWKFLRLRPANFATVRIAQLASFIACHPNLFSLFVDHSTPKSLFRQIEIEQSSYWTKHYDFAKAAKSDIGSLGKSSIENIVINTVVPLLFSYGVHSDDEAMKEKAIRVLGEVKPEKNSIISRWVNAGMEVKSAFDTQALIDQYNSFCLKKQCLSCPVGAEIIRTP